MDDTRDRNGSFDSVFVAKNQTRHKFDDQILRLYAKGMSTRDIAELYGADISPALVSQVTNSVLQNVLEWQSHPLDSGLGVSHFVSGLYRLQNSPGQARHQQSRLCWHWVWISKNQKELLSLWMSKDEGAKVLAIGTDRTEKSRHQRHDCRLHRWLDRFSRGHSYRVSEKPRCSCASPT